MVVPVLIYSTFTIVTTYKQCLSYHESKFFLDQLVVYVNNKFAVFIKEDSQLKYLKDIFKDNTKLVYLYRCMLKCLFELYMLLKVSQCYFPNSRKKINILVILKMHYDVSLFLQCYFGNLIVSESNNIMHYIMFITVPTQSTFTRVTTYKQCLSYHESKFFLDHLVV